MTEQSITQKKNEVLHRTALLATEERATKAEAVALEAVLKVNDALAKLPDMRFLVEQAYYLGIHHAQELSTLEDALAKIRT